MSPGRHTIQLRFTRRNADGSASVSISDDILHLVRVNADTVRVIYVERGEEYATFDVLTCTHHQLLAYLYRMFWLITLDEDPFHSVKFYIPGFPVFMQTVASVQANIPSLLDILLSACMNWPTIGFEPNMRERNSQHSLGVGYPQETPNSDTDGNAT